MKRLERYKQFRQNRLDGKFNGAPFFHSFPRLGKIVPSIPRGMQLMILAGNGVGKSMGGIALIIMTVYNLIKNHNYKAKFHIFLLEDPIELFEDRIFCRILYTHFNIEIDPMKLNSVKEELISEDIIAKFEETDKIVEDILSYCIIVENIFHATGIYKTLRTRSDEIGKHIYENREFTYKKDDESTYNKTTSVYKEYIPDNPELHNIVLVDNLNNLSDEFDKKTNKHLDLRGVMDRWCKTYARLQICKHWNWTVINIQQQDLATDKKQFDMKGFAIIEKTEPNLASLGDNKTVSRAHHLILALFAPARFGITQYEGYDISRLGDSFRALLVLKSNFSISNVKLPLYFNGSCSYYSELPKQMTENDYIKYKTK